MKKILTFFLVSALPLILLAQKNSCTTDDVNREILKQHPGIGQIQNDLDAFTQDYIATYYGTASGKRSEPLYIIPIVFHIIHNYGTEAVTDEQIYDAVTRLNDDFRKRASDTSAIVSAFKGIAADCEIEFRLPTDDPKGNCTNGIERVQSTLTYAGDVEAKFNPWPRDQYLNIWLVESLTRDGAAAWALYPSATEGLNALQDGIIGMANYITGNSRTLPHEIGHSFNLRHTWGNSNECGAACGDDGVFDTPLTEGSCSGCPLNDNNCVSGVIENTQNFMNYSSCPKMFTEGQKQAMHAALNSEIGKRNQLWSENTLNKTGAVNSTNENTCLPVADFIALSTLSGPSTSPERGVACVGTHISFKDFSSRGPITAWDWVFTNANPSTATDQNPVVTFTQAGWQTVTLTVTNEQGQHTVVKENYILVVPGATQAAMFSENFEDGSFFDNNWAIENYDNNPSSWKIYGNAAYSGGQCLGLNTLDVNRFDVDVIYTPLFNLAGADSLEFKYSLGTRATTIADMADRLRIYYSINCGQNWQLMATRTGSQLTNAGFFDTYFVPNKKEHWSKMSIVMPVQAVANGSALFKLEFTAGNGFSNNFYIDDINIEGVYTSISAEPNSELSLNIYPNPSESVFTVQYSSPSASRGIIKVFDPAGKQLMLKQQDFTSGLNTIVIDGKFNPGMYYVILLSGDKLLSKPVIITSSN